MWFLYALVHTFLLALVNYIDEYLAVNNKLPENANIHTKVGSVLLISTLMSFVGALLIIAVTKDATLSFSAKNLALLSSIPMVIMYASYFYLLQVYPIHQVAPVFQISSIWLLIIELLFGKNITPTGLMGVIILMYGAYILDTGAFKWKIPTKLLLIAVPATLTWAIALFMVRIAAENNSAVAVTFWQMIGIGILGIFLLIFVKSYRGGFFYRIQHQGKKFLGSSLANETFAEMGYVFGNLAVALAPVAAYVPAMSGIQSLFVLIMLSLFPLGKRVRITQTQWVAVFLIAAGVFLIKL